jgi:hypothetical protein
MDQAENSGKVEFVAKAKVAIINGRMPVAIVALLRFGNQKGESTKALATLAGTTVGKIDDIKKNRNFAYVTDAFKPTQEQKDAGISWLKTHPYYDAAGTDKLVSELDGIEIATAEEAAAFEGIRVAARGQLPTTKEGEVAAAGGGNRRAKKEKKSVVVAGAGADAGAGASADTTAESLLA